ncbi:hypothetical protein [Mucilaginibacter celer]|uniref:hypothetical protein n=1 Tax=Mucilaginibacter celer TaxID=2305508 RepID=UPI0013CE5271|nr:hypothetical protein [Mucilaginibacter celer]
MGWPREGNALILIMDGFMRYDGKGDDLMYDERPVVNNRKDDVVADSRPSQTNFEGTSSMY